MERIPVSIVLARCNVVLESVWCPVSREANETAKHLLVSCKFAQGVCHGDSSGFFYTRYVGVTHILGFV